MTAPADAALHVAFQGYLDIVLRKALYSRACAPNRIIGSGPHRNAVVRSGCRPSCRRGSVTKPVSPPSPGSVRRRSRGPSRIRLPVSQFGGVEEIAGAGPAMRITRP